MTMNVTRSWVDELAPGLGSVETTTRIDNSSHPSPMAMPAKFYLGVDISLLILQALSFTGNGFIILLFLGTTRLRRNTSLRLLLLLCMTDFVFAISTLPYTINYVVGWNPIMFDYDPMYIITSSIPLVVQFKVNLIITIMIAVDRLQAMKAPAYYRGKNQMRFVWLTLAIGLILGAIDVVLEYHTTTFNIRKLNCAAIGCHQDPGFRAYWGISNMALNTVALILTLWVAVELNRIRGKSSNGTLGKRDFKQMSQLPAICSSDNKNNYFQANKLSFGILVISFVFLMVPSTFVGVVELAGLELFKIIGPFYILGLLAAGVSNSIVYIRLHVELKQAAVQLVKYRSFKQEATSVVNIAPTTTVPEGF
ncbi:hypothetical protein FO519_007304 [Halicephalobus sp. NKZ332]|nr:hypothetical protein FO519_007304 [Halicephalobus sp. NKZ332]